MLEAIAMNPAAVPGLTRPSLMDRQEYGPEWTLNNGRGCVKGAENVAYSMAESGPAVLIVDVVVREGRRGQGQAPAKNASETGAGRLRHLPEHQPQPVNTDCK